MLRIGVLGPLRVTDADGRDVTPDGDLQRRLLALLVLRRGHVVSVDDAVEALWPRRVPADPAAALQTHVFRLRRALPDGLVASSGAGYRVEPERIDVDAERLARAVTDAGALLAADPAAAAARADGRRWRPGAGPPTPSWPTPMRGGPRPAVSTSCASGRSRCVPTPSSRAGTGDDVLAELTALATSTRCASARASC